MLNQESSLYFYNSISEIIANEEASLRERLLSIYALLKELIKKYTEESPEFFSSNYTRYVYILDKLSFSKSQSAQLQSTRYFLEDLKKNKEKETTESDLYQVTSDLLRLISKSTDSNIPEELMYIVNTSNKKLHYEKKRTEKIALATVVVIKQAELETERQNEYTAKYLCNSQDFDDVYLYINSKWKDLTNQLRNGSVLNLCNVRRNKDSVYTDYSSILVLEPDYYTDATEIAESFNSTGYSSESYFIKKFSHSTVSDSLVIGNAVNYLFDSLIENPDADFESKYIEGISFKPLQIFSLAVSDKNIKIQIREKAEKHFQQLKQSLNTLKLESVSIEPSFCSQEYGLQGRLDLLIEYPNEPTRKDVLELKSGKAAGLNLIYKNPEGSTVKSGIWVNHMAQATVYNMLLDSAFKDRTGSSSILYSSANESFLRNAPNIVTLKQDIIRARNEVVSTEIKLANGDINITDYFKSIKKDKLVSYTYNDLQHVLEFLNSLTETESKYINALTKFIFNELLTGKIQSDTDTVSKLSAKTGSNLINGSSISDNALGGLELITDESDLSRMYLSFRFLNDDYLLSSFRKGDMIILFPISQDRKTNAFKGQLLKGIIKSITRDRLVLSLRNKLATDKFNDIAEKTSEWAIDTDSTLVSTKALFRSLIEFLQANPEQRELILGYKRPEFNQINFNREYLSEKQNEILSKALSAKDYFLIQGPPGTGKTSYMLRGIVESMLLTTENCILILAYTNRAIDEIISSLRWIENDIQIIRLGNKESSDQKDLMLSYMIESEDLNSVYKKIKNARIVVSTVSSVLTNPEIFDIKKFDVAIVDEASQILEVNITGILARIKKFILIGDEKQLPAIAVQPKIRTLVEDTDLNSIFIKSTDGSLFERLLLNCKRNGWDDSYALLDKQARMHIDIMEFPNKYFYNNDLTLFDDKVQSQDIKLFNKDSLDLTEKLLASHRLIFIESEKDIHQKLNNSEADFAVRLIQTIRKVYGENITKDTIGVISPFRAQCASILKRIPKEDAELISVDTVERFQGSEREIIILSTVVNNTYLLDKIQSLTYFNDILVDRKLNVSITRAKSHLIILGNSEILNKSIVYRDLIEFIKTKNAYYKIEQF